MSNVAEFKSWFDAGILIRGRMVNEIKGAAWKYGLEFEHERAGSVVRFKVWGDPTAVSDFRRAYVRWGRDLLEANA